jgi:phenylalanine-4-hydroxylase
MISLYEKSSNDIWKKLLDRQLKAIQGCACQEFLDGFQTLNYLMEKIPDLATLSARLDKLAGWKLYPVGGLLESEAYFSLLANKQFPVATLIRGADNLDYSPIPDYWHDIFGHIPLILNPSYRDFIEFIAGKIVMASDTDKPKLDNIYWYLIEAGVCRENGELRVFGASQLSSYGEIAYVFSGEPQIVSFDLLKVCHTSFNMHQMQSTIYEIPSLDYLKEIGLQIKGMFE